ncbi:MAG: hypothetical protein IPP30_05785 [Flavobacterium sp.]|nr:hypothetical protein [Flavobacterium sp.]
MLAAGSNLAYQWYRNPGADLISGATASSFSPPTTTVGATSYYCVVSYAGTCGTAPSVTSSSSGTITVFGIPTATISGSSSVCQNSTASVTFTGANGLPPYEFQYIIADGIVPPLLQTIVTTSGNSVSLPVPTDNIRNINYQLVGVSSNVGSSPTCVADIFETLTVIVTSKRRALSIPMQMEILMEILPRQ